MSEQGPLESDRKQSLQNKCFNERRRRDQENHYYEELVEIISASISDMSNTFSVKPEKCAILKETVKQIKQIKQEGTGDGDSAVQQSQVSSSKPTILAPTIVAEDILGPLLLEALGGFLFVINSQGKVEFISDNVTQFLKYTQEDLIGKSVYNIIHVGDHAQLANSLLPMSVNGGLGPWQSDNQAAKGRVFNCRLLIKPPCNDNEDLEAKQTYVHQYESMQISSVLHPTEAFNNENAENSDSSSSVVCIARRLPLAEKTNTMLGVEQFTTKQDLNGKITGCDISGIVPGRFNCPDFVGQNVQDFCHANDIQQLSRHLQDAIKNGTNTSAVYRFKMQENRYVFVQTKSKLFKHPVNSVSEFVMSTHSIIRECDQDSEKGSASTSLMKSIIGPSLSQQNQVRANPPISKVNSSMANMALVGNNIVSTLNSGNFLGINNDNVNVNVNEQDFLSQVGWEALSMTDSSVSSTGNMNLSGTSGVATTTATTSWMTSLRLSQVQQLQRSLSTQPQRTSGSGIVNSKHPGNLLQYGQRSSSLDLGMQGQVQMPMQQPGMSQGQKSPGYAHSPGASVRNGNFQFPGQRGMMGYNRRSPAASPIQGFSAPFPPRTPSPMLSPSPGLSQNNWGHQPMPSPTYSGGHQVMENRLLQHLGSSGLDGLVGDKSKNKRPGKLCQLLTQTNSPSSSLKSEPGTPKGSRSRHNSHQGLMEMSPADSIQSPQPGPGQSPPEKPQSTSNDDCDHMVQTENKDSNRLLKSLLSQNDDMEEDPPKEENSSTQKMEQTGEAQATVTKPPSSMEMEKNEAEAKKPSNILLKQLLSTEEDLLIKNSSGIIQQQTDSGSNHSMMQELLEHEKKDNCRSVPAESTSIDSDLARQRHQSGPQEPQSTTTHSLPMPPLSSPLTAPFKNSTLDASVLQDMFSGMSNQSMATSSASAVLSMGTSSNMSVNTIPVAGMTLANQVGADQNRTNFSLSEIAHNITKNKKLDNLFNYLWEETNDDGMKGMKEKLKNFNLKRKASVLDAKGEGEGGAVSDTGSDVSDINASKLTKENALLTQLLSKKSNTDIVVNTLSTIQPSGVPQARLSQNLANRLLKVNPSSFITASSTTEAKRARTEAPSSSGTLSTLESALRMPKKDLNTSVSSSTPFDAFDIGNNSNSGISNISDSSVSSQLTELQQILQQTVNSGGSSTNVMEVNLEDNTDPLLAQILQQAQDLQHEISTGFPTPNQNTSQSLPLDSGINSSAQSSQNNTNSLLTSSLHAMNTNSANSMDVTPSNPLQTNDILQQLEAALTDSSFNLADLDLFPPNSNITSADEQMAIEAIQKQLMTEDPSTISPPQQGQIQQLQAARSAQQHQHLGQGRFPPNMPGPSPPAGSQMQDPLLGNQMNRGAPGMRGQYSANQGPLRQGPPGSPRSLQQLPGYSPQGPPGQNFPGSQGPRLSHPQGALQSPSQPQRAIFNNPNPNSAAMQVRQSLLQQQKLKQLRERDKQRMQQHQDRQKLLQLQQQQQQQQQQQRSQFNQQFPGERFPHDSMNMNQAGGVMPFPENLADLMNSGTAPNVTLQRGAIPGPMSPRYQGMQQPPQSPKMGPGGPMLPPNPTQLSPNFPQQPQHQQWNNSNMGISSQGGTQYTSRHRSLSGGAMQTSPPQRFPFGDGQFPGGNQAMASMYPGQQQQMFNQAGRNPTSQLQRQLSIPGRGSPRTSQSPFGGPNPNNDPLLISPHNVSPNSMRVPQQQQISPSYSQGGMNNGSYASGMTSTALTSPQYSQGQVHMGLGSQGDLDLNIYDSSRKPLDSPLSVNTPGSSQFIKQELRNICNARSQNMHQGQGGMMMPSPSPQYMSPQPGQGQQSVGMSGLPQQPGMSQSGMGAAGMPSQSSVLQQQLQSHSQHAPQSMDQQDSVSELPLDILEQIDKMTEEHGINDYKEEVIVPKKRKEAKNRYEKFQQLANSEDPDSKATNLFRKQLTLQPSQRSNSEDSGISMPEPIHPVSIVQNEPRTPIDEIKPANQKDSLLQQLLSD